MNHSFDIEVAEKHGIEAAIIIENLKFWVSKNKANNKNYYDGRTWVYNSVTAWHDLFPYIKEATIRRVLKELIKKEVLVSGKYNKAKYDQTLWYAFKDCSQWVLTEKQIDLHENTNGIEGNSKPIPIINTDINTDNNT